MNIRPVSDLRNKYPEIEKLVVNEDEEVYLTKNGYGTMVVMSLEKYSKIKKALDIDRELEERFGCKDIDKMLAESEKIIENPNTKYYTTKDVKSRARRVISGKKGK